MLEKPKISFYGDRALLLQWSFEINPTSLRYLLAAKAEVEKLLNDTSLEVINAYNELLIIYTEAGARLQEDLKKLDAFDFKSINPQDLTNRTIEVPVCYDQEFGLDLQELATAKEVDIQTLVNWHTAPDYTVYFIGFLPGFPYLGGLDDRLAHPRKASPRKRIASGAVGVAGNQTGIYPKESPAGWQIIGNCPIPLFDAGRKKPCLLHAGDTVKFKSVTMEQYNEYKSGVENGDFKLKSLVIHG